MNCRRRRCGRSTSRSRGLRCPCTMSTVGRRSYGSLGMSSSDALDGGDGAYSVRPACLVICGPTAGGKTRLVLALRDALDILAISADSRQIYRGFDIGTAKPTAAERSVAAARLSRPRGPDIPLYRLCLGGRGRSGDGSCRGAGRPPLVVGGAGFYIRALVHPVSADAPQELIVWLPTILSWTRDHPSGAGSRSAPRRWRKRVAGGSERAHPFSFARGSRVAGDAGTSTCGRTSRAASPRDRARAGSDRDATICQTTAHVVPPPAPGSTSHTTESG